MVINKIVVYLEREIKWLNKIVHILINILIKDHLKDN